MRVDLENIETDRLSLRRWQEADVAPFAAMTADPRVMEFFPAELSLDETVDLIARINRHFDEHGFGLWAVELKSSGQFIGFIGLQIPSFESHFTPCVEIGWRLAHEHWGNGYAPEGAAAVLDVAFNRLGMDEVVAMTAEINVRSRRVMEKLHMRHDEADDFDHPLLAAGSLQRHVLYRIQAADHKVASELKSEEVDDCRSTDAYRRSQAFLFDRIDFERAAKMPYSKRDMNISRMRRLLELLGDPHEQLQIVHIAGTKGKGSTTAFLSSAFDAAGIRSGSYTSPHLRFVEERFRINGQPCSPRILAELIESVKPAVATMDQGEEHDQPTFFEICTAIAFQLFVREQVDVAILEVGLGGRLDSTNVCTPLVSAITSISFDHVKQLGNTLAKIATEKAGIIKPGVPVVHGVIQSEPRDAIVEIAKQNGSELIEIGDDFSFQYAPGQGGLGAANFVAKGRLGEHQVDGVRLGLLGEHQAHNAAVAWAITRLLPAKLRPDDKAIRIGFERTRCEARIEIVSAKPTVLVDASHNVASVQALVDVLNTTFRSGRRYLILGATIGKDLEGMLRILLSAFDDVTCTEYVENPRAKKATALFELAQQVLNESAANSGSDVSRRPNLHCEADKRAAWKRVVQMAGDADVVCIAGSFFIAAEMKRLLDES